MLRELSDGQLRSAVRGSAPAKGAEGAAKAPVGNGERDVDGQALGNTTNGGASAPSAAQRLAASTAATLRVSLELSKSSFRGAASSSAPDGHGLQGATGGSALAEQDSRGAAAENVSEACRGGDTLEHQQRVELERREDNAGNASSAPSKASQLRLTPAALTMLLQLHNGERELLSELKAAAQKRAGKRSYVTAAVYNHTAHPATPLHNLREGAFGGYT